MRSILIFSFLLSLLAAHGQYSVPYHQNFDSVTVTNWSHYATTGTDDWTYGSPTKTTLDTTYSGIGAAVTKLTGNYSANSIMYLETPEFDLTTVSPGIHLQYFYLYNVGTSTTATIEYSTTGGLSWTVLNDASSAKINWTLSSSSSSIFKRAAHNLDFLIGNLVKFRFRFSSSTSVGEGWEIDQFEIANDVFDLQASGHGTYIDNCIYTTQVDVSNFVILNYTYTTAPGYGTVEYYLSADSVFDAGDSLYLTGSYSDATVILPLPVFPSTGTWYIFYKLDNTNITAETDEGNNVGSATIVVSPMLSNVFYDFENDSLPWPTSISPLMAGSDTLFNGWKIIDSANYTDERNYRGKTLFNQNNGMPAAGTYFQYINSPFFDFTTDTGYSMICYWGNQEYLTISGSSGAGINFSDLTYPPYFSADPFGSLPTEWSCNCSQIDPTITKFKKFRIFLRSSMLKEYSSFVNFSMDDIYIGKAANDLTIIEKRELFSPVNETTFNYVYTLWNAGILGTAATNTEFYWSNDSILDIGDILVGTQTEAPFATTASALSVIVNFTFTKPTLASGNYFLISKVDAANTEMEYNENNNISYVKIHQHNVYTIPYENNFETQITDWHTSSSLNKNSWNWGFVPFNPFLDEYGNSKLFYTYPIPGDSMGRLEIYSPTFDLTGTVKPVLEFDLAKFFGNGSGLYGFIWSEPQANISYSIDNGYSWILLDTTSDNYKGIFYWKEYESLVGQDYTPPGKHNSNTLHYVGEPSLTSANWFQSRDCRSNTRHVVEITPLNIYSKILFRLNLGFGKYLFNNPVLFDNFRIADAISELEVIDKPDYYLKPTDTVLRIEPRVDNTGNYFSSTSQIDFYYSSDSILDAGDIFAYTSYLNPIGPKQSKYLNIKLSVPLTAPHNYIVYEIDKFNSVVEVNESNNTGYFKIKDTILVPPYFNDFSDNFHEGWSPYVYGGAWGPMVDSYRFRNHIAPGENFYETGIVDHLFFTDRFYSFSSSISSYPVFHLESPEFDFSTASNIELSFKMMCVGSGSWPGSMGGTLEWTNDNGVTYITLFDVIGDAYNWFNTDDDIDALGGKCGWYETPSWSSSSSAMDSIRINLSFLGGQPKVKFRYIFCSNFMPYGESGVSGMLLDDFKITANIEVGENYVENNSNLVNMYYNNNYINIDYLGAQTQFNYFFTDAQGKLVYSNKTILNPGSNKLMLPEKMANGIYSFNLFDSFSNIKSLKFYYGK